MRYEKDLKEKSLFQQLKEYSDSDYYPFHMPGHKRQPLGKDPWLSEISSIDITGTHGFDNLHQAEGILKESMEWAATCYGADESYYLVNGSSSGILSAVCGCTIRGGTILISRNCHKSVYHGILLNELKTEYVYPQIIDALGIQGGIFPLDVEKKLIENPKIQAVVIVSPTYDGMVSDIEAISRITHQYGVPLIVDEAHGAHFPFGIEGEFPVSALKKGADVVIQSLHKTLPSLTQTAIIHISNKFLNEEIKKKIKLYLSIYQSSSPSYLFLATIENCIRYMNQDGKERLSRFSKELHDFYNRCNGFKHIFIAEKGWTGKAGIFDKDRSKIILYTGSCKNNGKWLGNFLREHYHLELEMCAPQYALALSSLWDQRQGLNRLEEGLKAADEMIMREADDRVETKVDEIVGIKELDWTAIQRQAIAISVCTIWEAVESEAELCRLDQCVGRVSASFVSLYPPGIPCLVPGEIISEGIILLLHQYRKMGFSIYGIQDFEGFSLKVLKKIQKREETRKEL